MIEIEKGKRFGRLVVEECLGPDKWGQLIWSCRCDCGKCTAVASYRLRKKTRSCGCLQREESSRASTKHGCARDGKMTSEYRTWIEMKQRCENPKANRWYTHGARGIKVCERWRKSFKAFLSDMGPRPKGLQLERIDNDGDYKPSNCKWASRKTQARNKTTTVFYEHRGIRLTLPAWAEKVGLQYKTLWMRLKRGMKFEDAIKK